jgi:hypothetical protein
MGMTLWLQTRTGRKLSQHRDDHSYLYHFADALDAVCAPLGQPTLSSFFDTTDLEYNMADSFSEEDADEADEADWDAELAAEDAPTDPETGLPYGLDAMQWFPAPAGLALLQALRTEVAQGPHLQLEDEDRQNLLTELDSCIAGLAALPADGQFHLAVIL